MKRQEVELALAGRAYLIIHGVEYENVGGSGDEGFCFVPVKHDGWSVLKYEQLLNSDYTIRIKDMYKMLDLGNVTAHEYCINSHGYNFYCLIGNRITGGFISIMNWGIIADFEPDSSFYNRTSLEGAFDGNKLIEQYFSKEEQEDICADIADNLTPLFHAV